MSNINTIKNLIKLFEAMKVDEFLTYLTEDAEYRFGNYPAAIGKEAIEATVKASHLDQIKAITFNIKDMWEKDDAVICALDIDYTRTDDSVLTLPCLDVFRLAGDKIKSMRVYMDATPLFAPPAMSNVELVKKAFAAVEANDIDQYVSMFTDDALYKIANYPAVTGPQGIREFAKPVMQMFKTVTHDIKDMWEFGDKVICEMDVTYTRQDGKVSTVPCLDIIQCEQGKVKRLQAFIDASPAFM
jgi:ketosteroid isomerase-like protein